MTTPKINSIYPSDRELLKPNFDNSDPLNGVFTDWTNDEYRNVPGLSPSDLKLASEDMGSKFRGHIYRLVNDKMRRWCNSNDAPLPTGFTPEKKKDHFTFGTLYHSMLLEPEKFDDEYFVFTEEVKAELTAKRKERKMADYPTEFNARWGESVAAKKANGGKPLNDDQKAEVLAGRQKTFADGIGDLTDRAPEYKSWLEAETKAGKIMAHSKDLKHVEAMVDALHHLPENSELGEMLVRMKKGEGRIIEPQLFYSHEYANDRLPAVQCKGRPDIMADDWILDPKAMICTHPHVFNRQADSMGYVFSMGMYCWLTKMLAGHPTAEGLNFPKKRCGFLVQEKLPPYLARIHWIPEEWLKLAMHEAQAELHTMADVWSKNEWSRIDMAGGEFTMMPSAWTRQRIEMLPQTY